MLPLRFHRYLWLKGETTSWLKVPYTHLKALCLEKRISPWSKWMDEYVLLEKSIDAKRFTEAWENFNEEPIEFTGEQEISTASARALKPYLPN